MSANVNPPALTPDQRRFKEILRLAEEIEVVGKELTKPITSSDGNSTENFTRTLDLSRQRVNLEAAVADIRKLCKDAGVAS